MSTSSFPVFLTKHLQLRQLTDDDASALSLLRSNDTVNKYIDRPESCSIEEAHEFITKINNGITQRGVLYWAICFKDIPGLIGTICLWNFSDNNKTAEIGYELYPDYHGQGLMDEAIQTIVNFGFNDGGFSTIDADVCKENKASIKLLEKRGFKVDDTRKSINGIIYSLTINNDPQD